MVKVIARQKVIDLLEGAKTSQTVVDDNGESRLEFVRSAKRRIRIFISADNEFYIEDEGSGPDYKRIKK